MGTDVHAVFQTKLGRRWVEVPSAWEQDRHYLLFSWLAGVRNGFGFGGIRTYDPIQPIAEPRGLPSDFECPDGEWVGDHSFSWLTADEILAAKVPPAVRRVGVVPVEWFRTWDGVTPPTSYSGGISGPAIQVDTPATVTDKTTHVSISWIETENPFAYFIDEVRKLKEAHGNVRMVFGFDS
jgi:hypothetical protein